MSVCQVTSGWLALKPRIWSERNRLCARTGFLARLLCLFACDRRVVIDLTARVVSVRARSWWFVARSREIPFERVAHIEYRFGSLPTELSIVGTTDQIESFTVALELREPRETIDLATFHGEGAAMTGWPGALLGGDSLVDFAGDQESASRGFVRALQAILKVPIGSPVPHVADAAGVRRRCSACGRNSPPKRRRCQYCGGDISSSPAHQCLGNNPRHRS